MSRTVTYRFGVRQLKLPLRRALPPEVLALGYQVGSPIIWQWHNSDTLEQPTAATHGISCHTKVERRNRSTPKELTLQLAPASTSQYISKTPAQSQTKMKIFAVTIAAIAVLSAVEAVEQASIHLRIHGKDGSCTITNESQCNGQNWTGSTCCADSNYECRWSDDGQNVQRCQKKTTTGTGGGNTGGGGSCTITNESQCNGQNWTGSTCCADSSYECRWSDDGQNVQRCQKKKPYKHHHHHKGGSCTITNESQCDGQNWTGSTCCADPSYECRWSDDGQNVKRCQKKKW